VTVALRSISQGTQRRLAAIVAADVAGYSRLIGVDEAGTLAPFRSHGVEVFDQPRKNNILTVSA